MNPETMVRDQSKVPAWALGATAEQDTGYSYECHALLRNGKCIGWMYDDGAGYQFAEGEFNAPADQADQ